MAILCVPEKLQRKVVTWQWHGERDARSMYEIHENRIERNG
jgi:hypothetical protein